MRNRVAEDKNCSARQLCNSCKFSQRQFTGQSFSMTRQGYHRRRRRRSGNERIDPDAVPREIERHGIDHAQHGCLGRDIWQGLIMRELRRGRPSDENRAPFPPANIALTTALQVRKIPFWFTAVTRFHSSSEISRRSAQTSASPCMGDGGIDPTEAGHRLAEQRVDVVFAADVSRHRDHATFVRGACPSLDDDPIAECPGEVHSPAPRR